MSFKEFIRGTINYHVLHFRKKRVLLEANGEPRTQINLSFEHLSDLYLQYAQEQANNKEEKSQITMGKLDATTIKITDSDLEPFWEDLDCTYTQSFNIEGQDIGDQTILKLSQLYSEGRCAFNSLQLSGNYRITGVSIAKLGQSLHHCQNIRQICLNELQVSQAGVNRVIELIGVTSLVHLDLGLIGNESLKYLSTLLNNQHCIEQLGFGQNRQDPWQAEGKSLFQKCIRRIETNRCILSINIYAESLIDHYEMISELNLICRKNRTFKLQFRQNEFKAAALNPSHSRYYQSDNHSLNAYKFSVKSYLNNVFGSTLDSALYFLEKERRNSLREEAIFNITQEPINKIILEDICTADGSIIVLTKYLLNKIKEEKKLQP